MKITVKGTAKKGDVWATLNFKIEGSCPSFYLDNGLKAHGSTFAPLLEPKGWAGDWQRYGINRSKLSSAQSLTEHVEQLINHLIDHNSELERRYPEEDLTISRERRP